MDARRCPNAIAPIIAVPTTAGTGSEVGRAGVVTHPETHEKKIIFHPAIMPKVAILDPELTVGLPPKLTAATGMDALAHCLEAYCAPFYHPLAQGMALEGMRLVKENLPKAVKKGSDLDARGNMLMASTHGRHRLPARAWAPFTRCRIRSAGFTTRIMGCSTASSCPMC